MESANKAREERIRAHAKICMHADRVRKLKVEKSHGWEGRVTSPLVVYKSKATRCAGVRHRESNASRLIGKN